MKKALVVRGGWDGHEPVQASDRFLPFLREQGFELVVHDDLDVYTDDYAMKDLNLIVPCWTMGEMSPDQERGLLTAVREGAGIAGWHGGMCDSFRLNTGYQFMTGGQWVEHPGGIVKYTVNITRPEDTIMAGLSDFEMESEQYYLHVDPGNVVLAATTFSGEHYPWIEGTVIPVVWKRMYGAGKVFYSSLGHVAKDFDVYEAFEIMKRGMLWACR